MSEPLQFSLFDPPTEAEAAPATPLDPATYDQIPLRAEVAIPAGTYRDLEALAAHCQQCQRCGLAATRTHVVVSRGNPAAKLMIIGEGPGQAEDESGRPFVGKAGQLLDKILASVNLDSERDAYICNIVKCRPPGNRVPTPVEAAACLPYLLEQIRLVNPRIILLAGATAVSGLLKDNRGITKIRGQWIEWQGRWCMPIFHPAYLLRNNSREPGSPKWLTWQDIQAVRDRLRQLDS
ncbi:MULTISPECIES: uracil-DNA glycosylase [unclassified Thermosynechococcus]|uniref:uracil-DNA glycosylase n=1 Tax=unclassified Thermosynechococcus TaxID=2622553 RepID=UPI0019DBD28D|nr:MULTISPECIES: uracil-DNA glycosylase [unclassified Thermosynechococcus]HIK35402.1 uracil-DNA glycosylase [Thermosynechococcus sp. M98_K2018_005]HIK48752.1 uracil-DNA glycosylase [Thermosynechococcus sp. M55_K2018_012]